MPPAQEQRNRYRGNPEAAWLRVSIIAADGSALDLDLLADTGNPCPVIIGTRAMAQASLIPGPVVNSNFGTLVGGFVRVVIPDIGFDKQLLGFASDPAVTAVQAEDPGFEGLIGLPLLRLMEYGGDADHFWIRPAAKTP